MQEKIYQSNLFIHFLSLLHKRPTAKSVIRGSALYPEIEGIVYLYQTNFGVIAAIEVTGLPKADDSCKNPVFGLHIHSGNKCAGAEEDPFAEVMTHYNPDDCAHPYHAGDLPPLFGNNGYAFSMFLTDRFDVNEVIGKTIIIHAEPDDFTSQPSGNAGEKIACGVITPV